MRPLTDRRCFLAALLLLLASLAEPFLSQAQLVLTKDINANGSTGRSLPADFVQMPDGDVIFVATSAETGRELWKTDGTEAGTVLLKDISPGTRSSIPYIEALVTNNLSVTTLFFLADDGVHGEELWKTDGTPDGTVLVKDINPGLGSGPSLGGVAFNGLLFFSAQDPTGDSELWQSDGTEGGTVRFKDIRAGSFGSNPSSLKVVGSNLFFNANGGNNKGTELWKTDGTDAGTVLVKDINPGSSDSSAAVFRTVGNTLYFRAITATAGSELWKSDGTEAGTLMVKDINPGSGFGGIDGITPFQSIILFGAQNQSGNRELWKSDGTEAGTVMVKDIYTGGSFPSSDPSDFCAVGNVVFFFASDAGHSRELWKTDGTEAGTVMVRDINPGIGSSGPSGNTYSSRALNGKLYFYANDGTHGSELWTSDGTEAGTVMVKDINPGAAHANILNLTVAGSSLYFSATNGTSGPELFKSDGTADGTVLLKDIGSGTADAFLNSLTDVQGRLFFSGNDGTRGTEVWVSDGTSAGTLLPKDVNPNVNVEDIQVGSFKGFAYFSASNGVNGYELWRSDGTAAGTTLFKDIYPGAVGNSPFSSSPYGFTALGDNLFFIAYSAGKGGELWKTAGTAAGTVMVKDIYTGSDDSEIAYLTPVGNTLYFVARDDPHGAELWKSNGTAAGTVLVKDIDGDVFDSDVMELTNLNGTLFFSAYDDDHGQELWKSNGTAAGTVMLKDINTSSSSAPAHITVLGNIVLFKAFTAGTGYELWKSDGTSAGTVLVKDIAPGPTSSTPSGTDELGEYDSFESKISFTVLNGFAYFAANTAAQGIELWKSDGTAVGTVLVKDIAPGAASSSPKRLTAAGNYVYFDAETGGITTLWRTDGTQDGTVQVDPTVTNIQRIKVSGTSLFVSGNRGDVGQELFVLPDVREPILINTQPLAQVVNPGATVTFTVAAVGIGTGPLTYQWRKGGEPITGATGTSLKLVGVKDTAEAVYDVLVHSGNITITSDPAQLIVRKPVAIVLPQPAAVLARTETDVSFTAALTGTAPDVQWYKGAALLPGATGNPFVIQDITLADAGLYKARISNPVNTLYTVPAQLAVVDSSTQIIGVNDKATMVLKAPAVGTGLTYQWLRNGLPMAKGDLGGRITNVTAATLTLAKFSIADEAVFSCRVTLGAQQVTSGNLDVRRRDKPDISAKAMPPAWIVSGLLGQNISTLITINNSDPQHAPTSYTIVGLPLGLSYNKTTGLISGRPLASGNGTITLKITAINAAGSSATTVLVPISALPAEAVGEFRGLINRHSNVNANLGASLNLTISTAGILSGKVMHGTVAIPFSAGIANATVGSSTVTAVVAVPRKAPLHSLQLNLTINGTNGSVTGSIKDLSTFTNSSLSAWRNPWRTTPVATPNLATAYEGAYTAAFRITTGQNPNPVGTESYPQGDGYALLKVTTAGVVTGTCRLADATLISVSTLLGPQGQIGLYLPAYGNTGSALGWQQIVPDASSIPTSYANNPLDGTLSWYKTPPAVPASTRSYNLGIPLHNLTVIGSAWRKPASLVLGLTDTNADNASLIFTLARIDETTASGHTAQLLIPFRLKAPTNTFTAPTSNSAKLALTVNATTGEISGLWITRDTNPIPPGQIYDRTANYYGAIITRVALGTGHFILPRLPTTGKTTVNTDILSGKMEFDPHP